MLNPTKRLNRGIYVLSIIIRAVFPVLVFFKSSCTHQLLIEQRNKTEQENLYYQDGKLQLELDIFRFKNNITKIKIGIFPGEIYDDRKNKHDVPSQINVNYSYFANTFFDIGKDWQEFKIDYFTTDEVKKSKIFNSLIRPFNKNEYTKEKTNFLTDKKLTEAGHKTRRISINHKYYNDFVDLYKRLSYYQTRSTFYESQSNFEHYLNDRSIEIIDRQYLQAILGEFTLSQSGLTKEKREKLELHGINIILVFSVTTHGKYEDSMGLGGDYISYQNLHAKLIYVKTSQVISTMEFILYF